MNEGVETQRLNDSKGGSKKEIIRFVPSAEMETMAHSIVDSAYKIHRHFGPGVPEAVYEECFCHELKKHGLSFELQKKIPVVYDGIKFKSSFRLDVIVEDQIICELKSVEALSKLHEAQILSYMRLSDIHLGFLINFNVVRIKDGIQRFIR